MLNHNSSSLNSEVFSAGTLWALLFLYKDIHSTRISLIDLPRPPLKIELKIKANMVEVSAEGEVLSALPVKRVMTVNTEEYA
jgi:hypothetical protein